MSPQVAVTSVHRMCVCVSSVYEDGDEDLQQLRASMERLLREPSEDYSEEEEAGFPGSPPEEQVGESQGLLSNGLGPDEDPPSSENELNEEWHSGTALQ